MAQTLTSLTFEMSAARDAVAELAAMVEALHHRHGAKFRGLERLVELTLTNLSVPAIHDLGGGRFAAEAPPEIAMLLRQGRQLGVIRC